jgi:hypothetical protein
VTTNILANGTVVCIRLFYLEEAGSGWGSALGA